MNERRDFQFLVGTGGIGSGMFVRLRGLHTLGRNESRACTVLRRRDFCKLHIIAHYVAVLMRSGQGGPAVLPVGKVGDDECGRRMLAHMAEAGMDARFVTVEPAAATMFSVCFVYPDGDGGNITTDDSASSHVTPGDIDAALAALEADSAIALAAPEVPLAARLRLLRRARQRGWMTVAAVTTGEVPEALETGLFAEADLVGVNRDEAAAIAGLEAGRDAAAIARAAGERLAAVNPDIHLAVTAGAAGAFGWAGGEMEHTPPAAARAVNTAGAGDAFLAGLIAGAAAGLEFILPRRPARAALAGAPLETAMDLAALVAGVSVESEDTINFDFTPAALADLARRNGADIAPLAGVPGAMPALGAGMSCPGKQDMPANGEGMTPIPGKETRAEQAPPLNGLADHE